MSYLKKLQSKGSFWHMFNDCVNNQFKIFFGKGAKLTVQASKLSKFNWPICILMVISYKRVAFV